MERYTTLSKNLNAYAATGSPVAVIGQAVLMDNEQKCPIGQIKFQNLTVKTIQALVADIRCFSLNGSETTPVNGFRYVGLQVTGFHSFGETVPVILPDTLTHRLEVIVKSVYFDDGSSWNADGPQEELAAPQPIEDALSGPQLALYKEQYCREAQNLYTANQSLWFCSCGRTNSSMASTCSGCGTLKKTLEAFSMVSLNEELNKRAEAEAAKKAAADAKREATRNRMRKLRIPITICSILVLFAVAFIFLLSKNEYSLSNVGKIVSGFHLSCISEHQLTPADCQHGKLCSVCGAEFGTRIDHHFDQATCIHKATCDMCGLETGELGDHMFGNATCLEPAHCMRCNAEGKAPLGHTTEFGKCTRCNEPQMVGDLEMIRLLIDNAAKYASYLYKDLYELKMNKKDSWGYYPSDTYSDNYVQMMKSYAGTATNNLKKALALCISPYYDDLAAALQKPLSKELGEFPTKYNQDTLIERYNEWFPYYNALTNKAKDELRNIDKLFA